MSEDKRAVGELYFSDELYGEDMVNLTGTIGNNTDFELVIHPLEDKATLYKFDEDAEA